MSLPSIISISKLLLGALAIQGGVQKPQAQLHNLSFNHLTLQDNIPSEDVQFPEAYQFLESDFDMPEEANYFEPVTSNHLVPAHIYPDFSPLKSVENKNNASTTNRKKAKRKYIPGPTPQPTRNEKIPTPVAVPTTLYPKKSVTAPRHMPSATPSPYTDL